MDPSAGGRVWFHGFAHTIKNTCLEVFRLVSLKITVFWDMAALFYSSRMETTIKNFDIHRAMHRNIISIVNPTRCTNVSNLFYFGMTL